jgi:hypothetical protein
MQLCNMDMRDSDVEVKVKVEVSRSVPSGVLI